MKIQGHALSYVYHGIMPWGVANAAFLLVSMCLMGVHNQSECYHTFCYADHVENLFTTFLFNY